MKIIAFILCLISAETIYPQKIRGIYITADDFKSHILSYHNDCKIRSGFNSNSTFIKLKYKDSIFCLKKDNLFGYMDNERICYRFYNGTLYTILNPGEQILFYKTEKNSGTPKYPNLLINYFFSKTSDSPIEILSFNKLLSSFQSNVSFTELIEIHFHSDNELIEFDNYHNRYKLNRLFELSNSKK